jgi:long-chain acyl-CoA synthetase
MPTEKEYLAHLAEIRSLRWPEGVPRAPQYPFGEVPLSDYLRRWAESQPEKPAIEFYGSTLSYGELDRLSDTFAGLLAARGVRQGDCVAVFMPNCPQFVIAFYGILKLGAVHVPVNPMFKAQELLYELNDTGAEIIVALDQLVDLVTQVRAQTRLREIFVASYADVMPKEPTIPAPAMALQGKRLWPGTTDLSEVLAPPFTGEIPRPRVGLDEVAALNYTGGTTGLPKGCIHTQRNMIYTAATTCPLALELGPSDVALNFYPMFWIAGEDFGLIFPIFSGATLVLLARWDPLAYMAAVERYRVTHSALLVDNAVEVLEHPEASRRDLRSLKAVRVSSFVKKLNGEYRRRWRALTGTTMIEAAWGMTETHTCDTFTAGMQEDDMDLKSQPVFVGYPVPGTEFKICDFETREIRPLGEEGEIVVRSPSLLKGYWNKPEATERALTDGWLHTGDIGVIDAEGYLHFLGRRKEMLKVKGMSVFPGEIEFLLGQHPAVLGSGVIGREDPKFGQVPVAFVWLAPQYRGGITEADLANWCRDNMANYKVPEIRFVDTLPMTATGKVRKDDLKALLLAEG